MEHFSAGWATVSKNLVGWLIFSFVFGLVIAFTLGLGSILMLNALRAAKVAVTEDQAPEIGNLFQFDNIVNDLMWLVMFFLIITVGNILCIIPGIIAAVLFFWSPLIVADGGLEPVDAFKASLGHAKDHAVEIVIFQVVASLIFMVSYVLSICLFGIPSMIASAVLMASQWHFFLSHRDEIYSRARSAGLPVSV
jgi:hypothetical protein